MSGILKNDLKHIGTSFVKVYPMAFRRIKSRWALAAASIIAIVTAFYMDESARIFVTGLTGTAIEGAFSFGRWYGSGEATLFMFLFLYITGLLFKKFKMRETAILIGEAYVFSGFVTLLAKSSFGRWRPYMDKGVYEFSGWSWTNNDQFSYFSGHAAVSFALSTILASTTENKFIKAFYYLLAVITCISRIYHQQHWLSDVVTGAIIAYLISRVLVAIHKEPEADYQ
jgi:membrane-associated phospholipid phosphatase